MKSTNLFQWNWSHAVHESAKPGGQTSQFGFFRRQKSRGEFPVDQFTSPTIRVWGPLRLVSICHPSLGWEEMRNPSTVHLDEGTFGIQGERREKLLNGFRLTINVDERHKPSIETNATP